MVRTPPPATSSPPIVLSLFAIGYATMAKHLTATGAFYGYIAHGLGRIMGMASGALITMAYVVFEGSLIGIFSYFFTNLVQSVFGIGIHWIIPALLMLVLNGILAYYDINITAKVLGVFLLTEIIMLSLGAFAVLFRGGGPDGFAVSETLNPIGAFTPAAGIVGASAGLGLFFAFWSWVGFESTAMYGEESRDPKRIVPRATMFSVVGIGLFYVFISWMAVAGTGPQQSVELAQDAATAGDIFFRPVRETYGEWAITMFNFLLGHRIVRVRHGVPQLRIALSVCAWPGRAFRRDCRRPSARRIKHGSPLHRVAGAERSHAGHHAGVPRGGHGSVPAPVHPAGHSRDHGDPDRAVTVRVRGDRLLPFPQEPPEQRALVQDLPRPAARRYRHAVRRLLLWEHKEAAAGAAAGTLLFKLTPWIVVGLFVLGAAFATYFKFRDTRRYELIGRIIYDETEVRE